MNVWRCPKCPYTTEQPAYVTAITHRCRPEIPRAYRLVPDQPQTPQEGKQ